MLSTSTAASPTSSISLLVRCGAQATSVTSRGISSGVSNGVSANMTGDVKRTRRFTLEDGKTRIEKENQEFFGKETKHRMSKQAPDGMTMDSPGNIFNPYVPHEQKSFILTPTGFWQRYEVFRMRVARYYTYWKMRKHVSPFPKREFARSAQKQFIAVNNALQLDSKPAKRLVREHMVLIAADQLGDAFRSEKTRVHWRFVDQVEPPRIVHAAVAGGDGKEDLWVQVTVRMCTRQIIATRDRLGRHASGSTRVPKTVLDFVVFERHVIDPYSRWRICGKVEPRGEPPARASIASYCRAFIDRHSRTPPTSAAIAPGIATTAVVKAASKWQPRQAVFAR